jgi:hypothetical protein
VFHQIVADDEEDDDAFKRSAELEAVILKSLKIILQLIAKFTRPKTQFQI